VPTTDIYAGIYVKNVPKTANLLKKALGAKARQLQPNMIELTVGRGRLLLNELDMKGQRQQTRREPCQELELGIWVDDVEIVHDKITDLTSGQNNADIPYVSEIEKRKSGIKDFRFRLPEGYYVRVTGDAT
jgi:hypothetical protein